MISSSHLVIRMITWWKLVFDGEAPVTVGLWAVASWTGCPMLCSVRPCSPWRGRSADPARVGRGMGPLGLVDTLKPTPFHEQTVPRTLPSSFKAWFEKCKLSRRMMLHVILVIRLRLSDILAARLAKLRRRILEGWNECRDQCCGSSARKSAPGRLLGLLSV